MRDTPQDKQKQRGFRFPWRKSEQIRQEIDDELAFHLEMRSLALQAKGVSAAESDRLARAQFGDLEYTKHYCRAVDNAGEHSRQRWELFQDFGQDLRHAVRALGKAPVYAVVSILTLALGIGAAASMFAFVNGVVLKPFPFRDPGRIVRILGTDPGGGHPPLSYLDLRDLRAQSHAVTMLSALSMQPTTLRGPEGEPERLSLVPVSGAFFQLFGIQPLYGRVFSPRIEIDASVPEVLVSEKLWRRRFGADPALVGKTIILDGVGSTVVGIVPDAQSYPADADLWSPMALQPLFANPPLRRARFLRVYGRLAPSATVSSADAELRAIMQRLSAAYPSSNEGMGITVRSLSSYVVGDAKKQLWILFGAVGCLLLIACANLANLTLVRALARRNEMAVRTALGAGRARLLRQSLMESLLLSFGGAAIGLLLARVAVTSLATLAHDRLPRLGAVHIDGAVLTVTVGIAMLTGMLFGFVPHWQHSPAALARALRDGVRSHGTRSARVTRHALVVAEIAMSMVLLTAAGLMTRSFTRLRAVDPGFQPDGLTTFALSLRGGDAAQRNEWRRRFGGELLDRLQSAPGVQGVAITSHLPMTGASMVLTMHIAGRPERGSGSASELRSISPGYFSVMGIPVERGRGFDKRDGDGAAHVVLLNEAAARAYFPDGNALGQRVFFEVGESVGGEIVGVVANVHHFALDAEPVPEFYLPFAQTPAGDFSVVIRSPQATVGIMQTARRVVHELDPTLALVQPRPLTELVSESLSRQRLNVVVLGFFALSALLLASVGLYGVMAYSVGQRSREIGVRIALGADTGRVVRMVVAEGAMLAFGGVLIGTAGALAATRLLGGLLFSIAPWDPLNLLTGIAVLVATALVASLIPARRAGRVDPLVAIRAE